MKIPGTHTIDLDKMTIFDHSSKTSKYLQIIHNDNRVTVKFDGKD